MQAANLMIDRLERLGLSRTTAEAILEGAGPARMKELGQLVAAAGQPPGGLVLLASGLLKATRDLPTGATQTVALFVPGDLAGAPALALRREASTVTAITRARFFVAPVARLRALMGDDPAVAHLLWRATAWEAGILQEWLVGMGRRTAHAQVAHLCCEIAFRMRSAGRVTGDIYDFPLTQPELADLAGLSPVHINRVLQNLRADGLIELSHRRLRIRDWRRLAAAADFDPLYLEQPAATPGGAHAAFLLPPDHAHRPGD